MYGLLPVAVYLLCFATSCTCAYLLARSYRRTRMRLLFWSTLCFALLAVNNLMVIFDMLIFPDIDFQLPRMVFAFAGVAVLLFGFIWDMDE
jgi:hypothetical protein